VEERLQKIMAQAGLGSRRACEELIAAGRVTVNGKVAILGSKADPAVDRILVDRQPVKNPEAPVYIAIYKPRGVLSTVSDPDPRPTVRELVDLPGQFYPVGRLDVDSEGLVLLTNDGDLANRLTHPRYGHEKEYRVLVARRPDEEQLATWRRGVVLADGYRTAPAEVHIEEPSGKGMWLRIVLREGRKRQIRETGSLLGLPVVKIIRVRIGTLYLGSLKPRQWRMLTQQEVEALKEAPPPGKKAPRRMQPKVEPGEPAYQPSQRRPASAAGWSKGPRTRQRTPGKGSAADRSRNTGGEASHPRGSSPGKRSVPGKGGPASHERRSGRGGATGSKQSTGSGRPTSSSRTTAVRKPKK
jgi:23S rRNA pseudouridine2605 synthase